MPDTTRPTLWEGGITFFPHLAAAIKAEQPRNPSHVNKTLILSCFRSLKPNSREEGGYYWHVYPLHQLHRLFFPYLTQTGLDKLLASMRAEGLLIATNEYNKRQGDKTLWYRINDDKLADLVAPPIPEPRNKHRDADDPARKPSHNALVTLGSSTPPTSATAEQSAPQTTPTPAEPTQDVTAAHVGQKGVQGVQEAGGAAAPTRTPASALLQLGSMTFHHAPKHNLSPRMFYRPTSDEPQFITWEGDEIWKSVNCRTEEFVRAVHACTGGFIDLEAPPEMKVWIAGTNVIFYVPSEELADYRKLLQGYA